MLRLLFTRAVVDDGNGVDADAFSIVDVCSCWYCMLMLCVYADDVVTVAANAVAVGQCRCGMVDDIFGCFRCCVYRRCVRCSQVLLQYSF